MSSIATTYAERTGGRHARAVDEYHRLIFATGGDAALLNVDLIDTALLAVNQSAGSVTGEPVDADVDRLLADTDAGTQSSGTIAAGDVDADVAAVGEYLAARQIVTNNAESVKAARARVGESRRALDQAIAAFAQRRVENQTQVDHCCHLARNFKPWEGTPRIDTDQRLTDLRWEGKTIDAEQNLARIPFDRAVEQAELALQLAEHTLNEAERVTIQIRNERPWIVKLATEQRLAQSAA